MNQFPEALVILTPAFPADETETNWVPFQQQLVKQLKIQHPHIQIIVLSFLYPYDEKSYEWNGVSVYSFNGMKKRKLKRVKIWMDVWKKLKTIHRTNKIIGLLSFWCGECALVGSYFARMKGLQHYCYICGMDAKKTNKMVRLIRPKPSELIGISDSVSEEFFRSHKIKPAWVIPNAIDPSIFIDQRPDKTIDVLGAGNFSSFKQYDLFLRVMASLKRDFPELKAIHCGTGSKEEVHFIYHLVYELDLENTVQLMGMVSHEKVIVEMQKAKIFLHPSNYEGFSTACLEALYAGAHVISFCQPMKEPIKHWHVVKDEKEMYEKAMELLSDTSIEYAPVLVNEISGTAKRVMELFKNHV